MRKYAIAMIFCLGCFGCSGSQLLIKDQIHHLEKQTKQNQQRIHDLHENVAELEHQYIFIRRFARKVCEDAYDPEYCYKRFPELY